MAGHRGHYEVLLVGSKLWFGDARLPRLLRKAGCRLTLLGPSRAILSKSRYIEKWILTPPDDIEAQIDHLRAHLSDQGGKYDWVIIPEDPLLVALAKRCPSEEPWLRLAMPVDPTGDLPAVITDKSAFNSAALAAGLPIPASAIVATADEAVTAAERIGFPVFMKPVQGSGGSGAGRADNHEQLLARFKKARGTQIIQSYINGKIGVVEALFNHGQPIWWLTSIKTMTHPGPYGPSTWRQFIDHPSSHSILQGIGAATGLHGWGGFDFMLDERSGRMSLIELHARATTALHMGGRVGWDVVPVINAMLAGQSAPPPSGAVKPLHLPMFPQDLPRAVAQSDRWAILSWLYRPSFLRDIPFHDPGVLCEMIRWAWPPVWGYLRGVIMNRLGLKRFYRTQPTTPPV